MARYGYGLLLPDVRQDYGLGPAVLGAIATGSYVAYLAATALAGAFASRLGARRTAVTAGLLAVAGMLVAGLSRSTDVFVVGILVAGASAGFAFAPFADAVRAVSTDARGRVLAAINCGNGLRGRAGCADRDPARRRLAQHVAGLRARGAAGNPVGGPCASQARGARRGRRQRPLRLGRRAVPAGLAVARRRAAGRSGQLGLLDVLRRASHRRRSAVVGGKPDVSWESSASPA